jgi:ATP-dependent DNA helicase RecG
MDTPMDTPLKKLVGEKTAKALAVNLDLYTAGDLLYHVPRRYDQRGEHTDIRGLQVGEQVTIMAQVLRVSARRFKQRQGNLLEVVVGTARAARSR